MLYFEKLLVEAARRYPIGTKIKCLVNNKEYIIDSHIHDHQDDEQIWFVSKSMGVLVYKSGVWAEAIIPEKPFNHETLLDTCIKITSIEHGAKVVQFYKENGFDTKDYLGDILNYPYYGVNDIGWLTNEKNKAGRKEIFLPDEFLWKDTYYVRDGNGEFVLSDRWYIELTEENYSDVVRWHKSVDIELGRIYTLGGYYGVFSSGNGDCWMTKNNAERYQIINYEQFKKYVLNKQNNNDSNMKKQTFKITREQFKLIYDIACPAWKDRIVMMTEEKLGVFNDECYLSHNLVKEMFDAATSDQLPTLEKIFPDYGKLPELTMKDLKEIVGYDFNLV